MKYKKARKLMCVFVIVCMVFSNAVCVFASNDGNIETLDEAPLYKVIGDDAEITPSEAKNYLINSLEIAKSNRDEIKTVLNDGGRVIILGAGKNAVQAITSSTNCSEIVSSNDLQPKQIGTLIYNDYGANIAVEIFVEEHNNDNAVDNAIKHCLQYDYGHLIGLDATYDYDTDWLDAGYDAESHNYSRVTIDMSIIAQIAENPALSGQRSHGQYVKTDITVNSGYVVDNAKLILRNGATSTDSEVLDYDPQAQNVSANDNVSIGLAWKAASVSFQVGSAVNISKVAGGIGSRSIEILYTPVIKPFNIPTPTWDPLHCEGYLLSEQSSTYDGFLFLASIQVTTCVPEYGTGKTVYDSYKVDRIDMSVEASI